MVSWDEDVYEVDLDLYAFTGRIAVFLAGNPKVADLQIRKGMTPLDLLETLKELKRWAYRLTWYNYVSLRTSCTFGEDGQ